ncbi:hypothetical protein ACFWH1_29400 [Streptomyces sp. NPDC127037]|uniref:hypothetical protein n=1 Tax=Streptomyces sp. NPDC127037 TaxID=3347113 RepID=UPI00364DAED1
MNEITNPVVAALPAVGWYAVYKDDNGLPRNLPMIGWTVMADGELRPMAYDPSTGAVFMVWAYDRDKFIGFQAAP